MRNRAITIKGARAHNLQNVDVEIPHGSWTVVTGVSGSGKSSLVFDTLYAEGQRRFAETLSTYIRRFMERLPRPEVDSIGSLPPAIALEQRNRIHGSRATVGSESGLSEGFQLWFARKATQYCCGEAVEQVSVESILAEVLSLPRGSKLTIAAPVEEKPKDADMWQAFRLRYLALGFTRVLVGVGKTFQGIFLEDQEDLPSCEALAIVVDRLVVPESWDEDEQSRLSDSLEQALLYGDRKLLVWNDVKALRWTEARACKVCQREVPRLCPGHFSFNHALGACPHCKGFGWSLALDPQKVIPRPERAIQDGAIQLFESKLLRQYYQKLLQGITKKRISVLTPYERLPQEAKDWIWQLCEASIEWCQQKTYRMPVRLLLRRFRSEVLCHACQGTRLNSDGRQALLYGKAFKEIEGMTVTGLRGWVEKQKDLIETRQLRQRILNQLDMLQNVGLGYLTPSRPAKTLSGGEAQRLQLAAKLSGGLSGTLYILDEPSVGLHPKDTKGLIDVIRSLRDQGNTIVMVEHDLDLIRQADILIELGPGAGKKGGKLLSQGVLAKGRGLTADYLFFKGKRELGSRNIRSSKWVELSGVSKYSLKNVRCKFPAHAWVVVTGVSGSGKSTLVTEVLAAAARGEAIKGVKGLEYFEQVVVLDQKPLARSSRSIPVTWMKCWDSIRALFAAEPLAIELGLTSAHFSFNRPGGRCETCGGMGFIEEEMHFFSDVRVPCEVCEGKRFQSDVLRVRYMDKNVLDCLLLTVAEAIPLFGSSARADEILPALKLLSDCGLGFLSLGQSLSTLSGGEAQRMKIAGIMREIKDANCLLILDEPTAGLHSKDVDELVLLFRRLVEEGHSLLIVEHHLEIMRHADWILDMGPGAGPQGGQVVVQGPLPEVLKTHQSGTLDALRGWLENAEAQ